MLPAGSKSDGFDARLRIWSSTGTVGASKVKLLMKNLVGGSF